MDVEVFFFNWLRFWKRLSIVYKFKWVKTKTSSSSLVFGVDQFILCMIMARSVRVIPCDNHLWLSWSAWRDLCMQESILRWLWLGLFSYFELFFTFAGWLHPFTYLGRSQEVMTCVWLAWASVWLLLRKFSIVFLE